MGFPACSTLANGFYVCMKRFDLMNLLINSSSTLEKIYRLYILVLLFTSQSLKH